MIQEKSRRRRRRSVTVAEIVDFLEYLAPPVLAAPPAPYGLQVGTANSIVKTLVVSPIPTYNAISCAAAYKAALMITAAPLLTTPLTTLRWDDPIGAKIAHLVQRQVSLYVLANAYAAAPGGFDDSLAERLGLAVSGVLIPTHAEAQLKFVVFVPLPHLQQVRKAASEAGAGVIGASRHGSFQTIGKGTFLPREGTKSSVEKVDKLEEGEEVRLEMVVSERELQGVIAAVLDAHPSEEVAYDIYPLRNPGILYGRGRIGELPLAVSLETVLAQVNDVLGLESRNLARCSHSPSLPIRSLAVASGTGNGESLFWAAHRQEAGALVMGGTSLNDLILADSIATVLIDVGFSPSVAPGLQRLVAQLRNTFNLDNVQVIYAP